MVVAVSRISYASYLLRKLTRAERQSAAYRATRRPVRDWPGRSGAQPVLLGSLQPGTVPAGWLRLTMRSCKASLSDGLETPARQLVGEKFLP